MRIRLVISLFLGALLLLVYPSMFLFVVATYWVAKTLTDGLK